MGRDVGDELLDALDRAEDGWAMIAPVRESGVIVEFRVVYVNQRGAQALGRPRAELLGQLTGALRPNAACDGPIAAYRSVIETGTPVTRHVFYGDGQLPGRFEARATRVGDRVAICFPNASRATLGSVAGNEVEVQLRTALDAAFDGFSLLQAVREPLQAVREPAATAVREPATAVDTRAQAQAEGPIVDFVITYTNEVGAKLAGSRQRDLIGRRVLELDPAFNDRGMLDHYRTVVESGTAFLQEVGDPAVSSVFEVKATRVAPDVVALSYRDITDRVRQERRVAGSEAAARHAAGRTTALQAATASLARAVTVDDVYRVMTDHLRPLAGWESLVVMLHEDHHLVVSHSSGLSAGAARNLRAVGLSDRSPMAAVVRDRTALFYRDVDEYVTAFPERFDQALTAGRAAWAFIPLLSAGRAIGAMALGYHQPRPFDEPEREALVSLGEIYGQAVERSMLFEAQRSIAADLQHALLPAELPRLTGARHAVRYLPWTSGADVGGDWYDIIVLGEDAVGVVIGDVAGHSTSAAATMGQIRNALRAYALDGHSPTSVIERVNRLLANVEPDAMATCCYLELHLGEGTATVVLAGHLPPILCRDADASPLDLRLGLPLGISPDTEYVDTTLLVPPGSALLLYTDGLVEDRRFPIGQGLAELCAALVGGPAGDPAALVERVLAADIGPRPRRDDVALLALSVDPSSRELPEPSASRRFRSDATSVSSARRFAADMLTAWGLTDLVDTVRLLLGEVITNAVQHTVGDVHVRVALRGHRLRVEVRDASERGPSLRPVDADSESGRGLHIVGSLADDWGHDAYEGGGKVVWFELAR